jgi:hypothetical protein
MIDYLWASFVGYCIKIGLDVIIWEIANEVNNAIFFYDMMSPPVEFPGYITLLHCRAV